MANVGYPGAVLEMGEVHAAARTLGLEIITLEIRRADDIARAFETLKSRADALFVLADPLTNTNQARIHALAVDPPLPTMTGLHRYGDTGGLMTYGTNYPDR